MTESWTSLFGDRPVALDGGLSTQLARRGHHLTGHLWTGRVLLDNPGAIEQAHADFIVAGARVVITASYQVSRSGFVAAGLTAADADAALVTSVAAARSAISGRPVRVAASVGPYGAILHDGSEYRGDYGLTRAELADFHRQRIELLVTAGPDLLAIETIPDVLEAQAISDALAGAGGTAAWMTFTAMDAERVSAGQRIEDAAQVAAAAPGVVAVGINCTDPRHVTGLVSRIASAVDLPIVVYPNAGGSWDARAGDWTGAPADGPGFTAEQVSQWLDAGAVAIGGCCGTDDRSIRLVADVLARTGP